MAHRQSRRITHPLQFYGGIFIALSIILGGAIAYLSRGPELDLRFVRDIPSDVPLEKLSQALDATINWPKWFFTLKSAELVDITGHPYPMKDQTLMKGAIIKMEMDPQKGKWRRFDLTVFVKDYVPGRSVDLLVIRDSSEHLTRIFDSLEWKIEFIPQKGPHPMLIHGEALAHTRNWRGRLFGKIAERILMNQVFYPDLIHLAELQDPTGPNPFWPTQQ